VLQLGRIALLIWNLVPFIIKSAWVQLDQHNYTLSKPKVHMLEIPLIDAKGATGYWYFFSNSKKLGIFWVRNIFYLVAV